MIFRRLYAFGDKPEFLLHSRYKFCGGTFDVGTLQYRKLNVFEFPVVLLGNIIKCSLYNLVVCCVVCNFVVA